MRVLLVVLLVIAVIAAGVSAQTEPVRFSSFSVYKFAGGLWSAHASKTVLPSDIATKGDDAEALMMQEEEEAAAQREQDAASGLFSFITRWLPSSPKVLSSDNAGFAGSIASAFTPEFTVTCQADGKPGFPRAGSIKGLPAAVATDLGTGHSNTLACTGSANRGNGQVISSLPASQFRLNTQFIVVPVTQFRANVYVLNPVSSLTPAVKEQLMQGSGKEAFEKSAAATTAAAAAAGEDDDTLIVTHQALNLHVELQNLDPLSGVSMLQQEQSSDKQKKKPYLLAHFATEIEPISKEVGAAFAKDFADASTGCNIQLTRASGIFTTLSDALVTAGVRYSRGCSTKNQSEEEDDESISTSRHQPGEHLIVFNLKRFAELGDEEVDLDHDTPWYQKKRFGPTIGAVVLLVVLLGGRRGAKYFFKKKGIDVDGFLRSTRGRSKEEIQRLRRERMAMKTGPITDEEVAKLQEEEDRKMVEELTQREAATKAAAAAAGSN